jgi:hypothetical protein
MDEELVDDDLAQLLGVDREALVVALGAGWRSGVLPREHSDDQWFVQGRPAQIAVGRVGREFLLARPAPRWSGVVELVWHFNDGRPFDISDVMGRPEVLAQAAQDIAARRRRTFRWCRTCRELQAPEQYLRDQGYCMGCASEHHGHAF